MTDTTPMVPTDAELWQLHMQMPGQHKAPIDFARAVLARWGQPAHSEEPLIRQLVASLEGYRRNHNDTQPCDAEREGRAWLDRDLQSDRRTA